MDLNGCDCAFAGFQVLTVMCTCMLILMMQSLDAVHVPKKRPAGVSCKPKELTALTKSEVEESLKGFVSNIILWVSAKCPNMVSVSQSSSH